MPLILILKVRLEEKILLAAEKWVELVILGARVYWVVG